MSVIIRTPNKKIKILCKGADSVIYERLHPASKDVEITETFLENFGNEGLRTLALAEKVISEEEYGEWAIRYNQASLAIYGREDKIAEVNYPLMILKCF
jgi:magnesium-transporting ATPase (P-type)